MGKIYTSAFKTLRGDDVSVEIWKTGSSGSASTLTLSGDEPVVIEYSQDSVFDELKLSTCSVKVITDSPVLDLYTGKLSDIELFVYREGSLIWYGFMSPNVYSMPLDSKNNELTLEFVDPLNAMSEVRFRRFGDKFFSTFEGYILQALTKVGASNVVRDVEGIPSALNNVGCMQRNYVDEVFDEEDGAMTWQDVVASIMRYMNKTAYCEGDTLKIYDCLGNHPVTNIEDLGGFAGRGSISLGDSYNKVTIVENTNPIDDLLDSEVLDDNNMEEFMDESHTYYMEESTYGAKMGFYAVPMNIKEKETDTETKEYIDLRGVFVTKSPWTLNVDVDHGSLMEDCIQPFNDPFGKNRFAYNAPGIEGMVLGAGAFALYNASYKSGFPPSNVDWDKSVMFYINRETINAQGYDQTTFMKYEGTSGVVMKGGYIIISLSWEYMERCKTELEKNYVYNQLSLSTGAFNDEWNISLKIGDKYWDGEEWTTSPSAFAMTKTWSLGDSVYNNVVTIDNRASFEYGLRDTSEGWLIPVNTELFGDIVIELCPPKGMCSGIPNVLPEPRCAKITKFKVVYTTAKNTVNGALDVEGDSDITLCNVLDDENVSEMDDVEFRTNTWSSLQSSYSYAIKNASGGYNYYIPEEIPEKTCIKRMVSYYKTPRMVYEVDMNEDYGNEISPSDFIEVDYLGKDFAVGGIRYDLGDSSAEVKLLETINV